MPIFSTSFCILLLVEFWIEFWVIRIWVALVVLVIRALAVLVNAELSLIILGNDRFTHAVNVPRDGPTKFVRGVGQGAAMSSDGTGGLVAIGGPRRMEPAGVLHEAVTLAYARTP